MCYNQARNLVATYAVQVRSSCTSVCDEVGTDLVQRKLMRKSQVILYDDGLAQDELGQTGLRKQIIMIGYSKSVSTD